MTPEQAIADADAEVDAAAVVLAEKVRIRNEVAKSIIVGTYKAARDSYA